MTQKKETDTDRMNLQSSRPTRRLSKRLVRARRKTISPVDQRKKTGSLTVGRCDSLVLQLNEKTIRLESAESSSRSFKSELQQFANAVSHDLQTPLRAISGFSQFLQEEYRDKLDETANGYIDRVVEGAARMDQLIKGLVQFSRVESNAAPFGLVSLNEVVEAALRALEELIGDSRAQVTFDVLPDVRGDQAQLTILLSHLIENGIIFNESETPLVHVSAEREGSEWIVSVRDNGIGIAEAYKDSVFEIFRLLNSKQKYHGVGAGLAICRRIVERHSGRIRVDSRVGSGSTFSLTIPTIRQE